MFYILNFVFSWFLNKNSFCKNLLESFHQSMELRAQALAYGNKMLSLLCTPPFTSRCLWASVFTFPGSRFPVVIWGWWEYLPHRFAVRIRWDTICKALNIVFEFNQFALCLLVLPRWGGKSDPVGFLSPSVKGDTLSYLRRKKRKVLLWGYWVEWFNEKYR